MTEGKTFTVTEQLNSEEDFNALHEVTTELEQAEADNIMLIGRIEELEGKLRKSALQELSALGQASEAYQAQLAAEARIEELEAKLVKVTEELEEYKWMYEDLCK